MKRRDFITLLGGAAAWPLAAQAQQDGRMRRVAVLALRESPFVRAVLQELGELGWIEGRNLRLDGAAVTSIGHAPMRPSS
jgi:putative ABC transport system substrate-binding protein